MKYLSKYLMEASISETGKGYSSHFREKTYIFEWRDGYYECKNA